MSVMSHYPNARKLRQDSVTKGLSWADTTIQSVMVSSARIRAEETVSSLEAKGMYDATSYGQVWIADNISYLSEAFLTAPTTEIVKAYIAFPSKLSTPDGVISADDYIRDTPYYKSRGIRYVKDTDDHDQARINRFVGGVISSKNRAATVAYVVLVALLDKVVHGDGEGITSVCGRIMRDVLSQVIVLRGKELKDLMEVPSVARLSDETLWSCKDGSVSVRGEKLLRVLGIHSLKSLSAAGQLVEGRALVELVCSLVEGLSVDGDVVTISESIRSRLDGIRLASIDGSCDARPVLERPVSDGICNSYREAPLRDFLVGGCKTEVSAFDRDAVDRLQGTAFKVNTSVLEVARGAIARGISVGDKLGVVAPEPLARLADFPVRDGSLESYNCCKRAWFEVEGNPERYRAWKEASEAVEVKRSGARSVNADALRVVDIATWYAEWGGAFYLPMFLDYRTRMYYLPSIFNPQASKLSKALFCANRGKAIGSERALEFWFVNFINCKDSVVCPITGTVYAGDKCPWDLAVRLGRAELPIGARIASDPFSEWAVGIWANQDDPFGYIAHCFECAGVLEFGLEFCSDIFLSMDGSCNAYQHASGYLADEPTAGLVNLTPALSTDVPKDLYGAVARYAAKSKTCGSSAWYTRKSVKRIVMCLGYGLTVSGAKKYAAEEIAKFLQYDDPSFTESVETFATTVMDSVSAVAPAIIRVKDALHDMGYLASKYGDITWTTATGTPVRYTKRIEVTKRADRIMGNKRVTFNYKTYLEQVDRVSVANAMAPNFTHSRDADHLRKSIMAMPIGTPFLVVHDSFGCLAADAIQFSAVIKEQFVLMYKERQVLHDLFSQVMAPCLTELSTVVQGCEEVAWWTLDNITNVLEQCTRKGIYGGAHNKDFRSSFRTVVKILDNIKQSCTLEFDNIPCSIYAFR